MKRLSSFLHSEGVLLSDTGYKGYMNPFERLVAGVFESLGMLLQLVSILVEGKKSKGR